MKKVLALALAVMFAFSGIALAEPYSGYNMEEGLKCTGGEFYGAQAVTDANTTVTFTKDSKAIYAYNRGANEVYVDPRDGVAVADNDNGGIRIEPNESRDLSAFQTRAIGLICSSAETTTVQLDVCY